MAIDIYGNYYESSAEIAERLIRSEVPKFDFFHKTGTKQGIIIGRAGRDVTSMLPKHGFYIMYKGYDPLYVGYSMSKNGKIYHRFSRFVKAVFDHNTIHEKHPAARRYVAIYGQNLRDIKIRIFEYKNLMHKEQAQSIERELIRQLNPILNCRIGY